MGAGYAPSAAVCRGLPLRPAAVWARKRALCMVGLRAAPCSPAAVWAHTALRLCSRPLSCPLPLAAATRYAAPLQKHIKTAPKSTEKRQKARFLCGISPQASLYASMDSTLKSPVFGGFRAAIDAAQSPKRYLKPSTWWGAAPFRAGGKAPMPPHSSLLQPTFITAANMPALPRKYAPRQRQRNSTRCPWSGCCTV